MVSKSKKQPNKRLLLLLSILGAIIVVAGVAIFAAAPLRNYFGPKSNVTVTVNAYPRVIDSGGPLSDARVHIEIPSLKFSTQPQKTDASGKVTFTGIPYGEIRVWFAASTYRDSIRAFTVDSETESFDFLAYPISSWK